MGLAFGCADPGRADPPPGPAAAVAGIVVTAQPPKSQTLIDRKVYTVTGNLQATTGSAADVLNEVPSVDVDADGAVTLRGDPNITILIDGKPSAAFSGSAAGVSLLQLPASEIERIEVMPTPPAQYRAEGSGGVINIVTRRTHRSGLTGTARANVGEFGRYVLGADASYNAGKLRLSGGVGLRHDIRERVTTDSRTESATTPTQSNERIDEHFHRLTPSLNAALDYDPGPRQSLGASANVTDLSGHRFFDQTDTSHLPGGPALTDTLRHSDGHESHIEESEEVHFTRKLPRPDESLSVSLQRSAIHEHERYAYANTDLTGAAPQSFDDLHLGLELQKLELAVDYAVTLPDKGDLKLGYNLEADNDGFDNFGDRLDPATGRSAIDPNVTNRFQYRQAVNALYGEYARTFGPWSLQAGLRAEAARARWLLITGNVPGSSSEFAVYPSLQIERALGDADRLLASISRRVTRPDPEQLNPFTDHQDIFNLRAGNPNLKPEDTWSTQLAWTHTAGARSFGLTGYYRIDRDSFIALAQPLAGGVVLLTSTNLPRAVSAGLEFSASGKLLPGLSYNLSGEAYYSQVDATALGVPGLRSTTGLNVKGSLEYSPTAADTAQISISRTDRRLTAQGSVEPINLVNLGFKHRIGPDLALVLTVSDAFDGQKLRRVLTTPTLQDAYQRYQVGRVVYLGFTYSFGGPAKPKSDFDYDQ